MGGSEGVGLVVTHPASAGIIISLVGLPAGCVFWRFGIIATGRTRPDLSTKPYEWMLGHRVRPLPGT